MHESLKLSAVASALDADVRTSTQVARQLGLRGLLFDAYSPSLSLPDLSQSGRREFRHLLTSEDLALVGVRAELGPKGFGAGADVDQLLRRLDPAMESAAGLGAPLLCVDVGPLPQPPRTVSPKKAISPEEAGLIILPASDVGPVPPDPPEVPPTPAELALRAAVNTALAELCAQADRYSVTIAASSSLASFAALQQVIAAARCPWLGVDLDPVAILRDEWSIDEILSACGPLIRHVRVRDAVVGADRRTKPAIVGQGSTDWRPLLSRLDESGYHGWLTIDPTQLTNRIAATRAALDHLNGSSITR